jgi:hypothetical protein
MGEARLYEVRSDGGTATVLLSLDELVEAAEQGRVTVATQASPEAVGGGADWPAHQTAAGDADESVRPRPSLWERIRDIVERVPAEAWESVPTDLSEQHDHYIYGTPKR